MFQEFYVTGTTWYITQWILDFLHEGWQQIHGNWDHKYDKANIVPRDYLAICHFFNIDHNTRFQHWYERRGG